MRKTEEGIANRLSVNACTETGQPHYHDAAPGKS